MSELHEKYDGMLNELRESFEDFMDEAEKGKEGRGSKTCSLKARKLSSKIANTLKDFRALSIENDKAKPVQKRNADSTDQAPAETEGPATY